MARDSVGYIVFVATVLCVVCSVLVSSAAVGLRERQQANRELDRRANILLAAGLLEPPATPDEINALFEGVESVLVDLETGRPLSAEESAERGLNIAEFDPRDAAQRPATSVPVEPPDALMGVRRREKFAFAYLVKQDGQLDKVVLPIYGNGLWGALYGFLALESDLRTISGITFYQHKETPGLGGEVENPNWKARWPGRLAFDDDGELAIRVIKGPVDPRNPEAEHLVDGLSGATITTRGVSNLVRYWLGPHGFGPFLDWLRENEANSTLAMQNHG